MSSNPGFELCGVFSGGKDSIAARWLRRLDWELRGCAVNGTVPPRRVIQSIDLLLAGEAAIWAENHPVASRIVADTNPTEESIKELRALLCERYPTRPKATLSFDLEIAKLKQSSDESIADYYQKVTTLMARFGARDRPSAAGATPLTTIEMAVLDTVTRAFARGLSDPEVRRETTRGLSARDRSLEGLYILAEQAWESKEEIIRLDEDEYEARELEYLRSLVHSSMSRSQIDSIVSSNQTNAYSNGTYNNWAPNGFDRAIERPMRSIEDRDYRVKEPRYEAPSRYEPPPLPLARSAPPSSASGFALPTPFSSLSSSLSPWTEIQRSDSVTYGVSGLDPAETRTESEELQTPPVLQPNPQRVVPPVQQPYNPAQAPFTFQAAEDHDDRPKAEGKERVKKTSATQQQQQQPQNFLFVPPLNVPQQFQPQPVAPQPFIGEIRANPCQVSAVQAKTQLDSHTKYLSPLIGAEKAFCIPAIMRISGGDIQLDKQYVQADQDSDMNVMSLAIVPRSKLDLRPLSEVGFKGLSIQTAGHRETVLDVDLYVEGIWRNNRCFVAPNPPVGIG